MAEELWNRVNIPFPGAVSTVRANFNARTGNLRVPKLQPGRFEQFKFVMLTFKVLFICSAAHVCLGWLNVLWVIVLLLFLWADVVVRNLLAENEKVLKLYESEVLQTEIRVLYELLYVLNNSYRNNKTFKALQQVRPGFSLQSVASKLNLEYQHNKTWHILFNEKYSPPFRLNNA